MIFKARLLNVTTQQGANSDKYAATLATGYRPLKKIIFNYKYLSTHTQRSFWKEGKHLNAKENILLSFSNALNIAVLK